MSYQGLHFARHSTNVEAWTGPVEKNVSCPIVQGKVHFSELMTGMINLDDAPNSIKLVGPSISCEATVQLPGGLWRSNPHVQSFAVATDQTGTRLVI